MKENKVVIFYQTYRSVKSVNLLTSIIPDLKKLSYSQFCFQTQKSLNLGEHLELLKNKISEVNTSSKNLYSIAYRDLILAANLAKMNYLPIDIKKDTKNKELEHDNDNIQDISPEYVYVQAEFMAKEIINISKLYEGNIIVIAGLGYEELANNLRSENFNVAEFLIIYDNNCDNNKILQLKQYYENIEIINVFPEPVDAKSEILKKLGSTDELS